MDPEGNALCGRPPPPEAGSLLESAMDRYASGDDLTQEAFLPSNGRVLRGTRANAVAPARTPRRVGQATRGAFSESRGRE
jgi:hypothetical protein